MELILSDSEREMVRQSLLDTIVNSPNFNSTDKECMEDVYHRIVDFENQILSL